MKAASLIVAVALALATDAPAKHATIVAAAGTVAAAGDLSIAAGTGGTAGPTLPVRKADDDAALGLSNYAMLALGLFGMGLVARRRRAD